MKILLLNTNPVVTKLVTLSAQKSGDIVDIAEDIDDPRLDSAYDLLIVDDSLYTKELMQDIASKINYIRSLYVHSRDSEVSSEFDSFIKKPFLPTELVDLFVDVAKKVTPVGAKTGKQTDESDEFEVLDDFDVDDTQDEDLEHESILNIDDLDEVKNLLDESDGDEFSLNDKKELEVLDDDLFVFDEEEDNKSLEFSDDESPLVNLDDSLEPQDEVGLDEEFSLDDILPSVTLEDESGELLEAEPLGDDELEITQDEEEDEISLDNIDDILPSETLEDESGELFDDVGFEDEPNESILSESVVEDVNDVDMFDNEIKDALSTLDEDDLAVEVDDDILLDLGSLSSDDFKMAFGEEIEPKYEDKLEDEPQVSDDEFVLEAELGEMEEQDTSNIDALKKLLEILSDEKIVASLKDNKININITIG